jgi:hypothetical protein
MKPQGIDLDAQHPDSCATIFQFKIVGIRTGGFDPSMASVTPDGIKRQNRVREPIPWGASRAASARPKGSSNQVASGKRRRNRNRVCRAQIHATNFPGRRPARLARGTPRRFAQWPDQRSSSPRWAKAASGYEAKNTDILQPCRPPGSR